EEDPQTEKQTLEDVLVAMPGGHGWKHPGRRGCWSRRVAGRSARDRRRSLPAARVLEGQGRAGTGGRLPDQRIAAGAGLGGAPGRRLTRASRALILVAFLRRRVV